MIQNRGELLTGRVTNTALLGELTRDASKPKKGAYQYIEADATRGFTKIDHPAGVPLAVLAVVSVPQDLRPTTHPSSTPNRIATYVAVASPLDRPQSLETGRENLAKTAKHVGRDTAAPAALLAQLTRVASQPHNIATRRNQHREWVYQSTPEMVGGIAVFASDEGQTVVPFAHRNFLGEASHAYQAVGRAETEGHTRLGHEVRDVLHDHKLDDAVASLGMYAISDFLQTPALDLQPVRFAVEAQQPVASLV